MLAILPIPIPLPNPIISDTLRTTDEPTPPQPSPKNTSASIMHPTAPLSPLETLPFDILLNVFSHLDDYRTVLSLSLTNSRLRTSLHPDALCTREQKIACYQHAEKNFPQHADRLVCFRCWRFLERDAFADAHRRGKRGKASNDPKKQAKRWCWECGTRERLFEMGRGWKRDGRWLWGCWQCGEWYVHSSFCCTVFVRSHPCHVPCFPIRRSV